MSAAIRLLYPQPTDGVDIAYTAMTRSGFQRRPGQENLSRQIRDAFVGERPFCAEAATGTGKTLAYLIGALEARRSTGLPIVISTATVALQEQIYRKDLPALADAGLLSHTSFVLTKGRGRYFCPVNARAAQSGNVNPLQMGLLEDFGDATAEADREVQGMLKVWDTGGWDGDKDSWRGRLPHLAWPLVQATRETCGGARCPEFADCPFYRDRLRMERAEILVANHSLVLADLRMRAEGIDPLFPFDSYQLVFDEAHHLPAIAQETGAGNASVTAAETLFRELKVWLTRCQDSGFRVAELLPLRTAAAKEVLKLEMQAEQQALEQAEWYRFPHGLLPSAWQTPAQSGADACGELLQALDELKTKMKRRSDPAALSLISQGRGYLEPLRQLHQGLVRFAGLDPLYPHCARWVEKTQEGNSLRTTPLDGAGVLQSLLWASNIRVVMVSATLQVLGDFSAFSESAALPPDTQFAVVPPVLPYHLSELRLPRLPFMPNDPGYADMLIQELSESVDPGAGTLVLFTNDKLMRSTADGLPETLRKICLVQGRGAVPALLDRHRKRIQAGQGSVLFGLQSFSEGLDLPGDLCTHVIITRLPFAFPDTPLEHARKEALGKDYFRKAVLPETARRLNQSAGRLVRLETDRGKITVLDQRLRLPGYGADLLRGLPPFSQVVE